MKSKDEEIDEGSLMVMSEENMKELNLKMGARLKLKVLINMLKPSTSSSLVNDITTATINDIVDPSVHEEHTTQSQSTYSIECFDFFNKKKIYPKVRI